MEQIGLFLLRLTLFSFSFRGITFFVPLPDGL